MKKLANIAALGLGLVGILYGCMPLPVRERIVMPPVTETFVLEGYHRIAYSSKDYPDISPCSGIAFDARGNGTLLVQLAERLDKDGEVFYGDILEYVIELSSDFKHYSPSFKDFKPLPDGDIISAVFNDYYKEKGINPDDDEELYAADVPYLEFPENNNELSPDKVRSVKLEVLYGNIFQKRRYAEIKRIYYTSDDLDFLNEYYEKENKKLDEIGDLK